MRLWFVVDELMVQGDMVESGLRLRGYKDGDVDAMYALDRMCFEEPFRFSRAAMRRFAESRIALVVVAEAQEEMVGFCIVHVERGEVGYVVTLDVAQDWRRRGVAGMLMGRMEVEAREAGCASMMLHVFVGNDAAIRFYERVGYGLVGEVEGFYGAGLGALVYRKALG